MISAKLKESEYQDIEEVRDALGLNNSDYIRLASKFLNYAIRFTVEAQPDLMSRLLNAKGQTNTPEYQDTSDFDQFSSIKAGRPR